MADRTLTLSLAISDYDHVRDLCTGAVTAEGIEDKHIERQLRRLGCTKGQGWHFGKPMPVGQTRKMLAEQNLLPPRTEQATGNAEFFGTDSDEGERKAL